jgi:anti-sigma factor RsiW
MTYTPCDAFISLIVRAADGALSGEDTARLETHAATCAGCRRALADQRAVHQHLAQVDWSASPGFEAAVMDAVRADSPWTERWNWRAWTLRLVPVAAIFAVVAVGVMRTTASSSAPQAPTTMRSLDLGRLASASDQAPVASALWSSSISDESLLSLVLTAQADEPLAAHLKDK